MRLGAICCIKTIFPEDVLEWFLWHKFIGVDNFYIVDNSDFSIKKILKKYKGVKVLDGANYEDKTKPEVYAELYKDFREQCDWIAVLDDDEFIFPLKDLPLKELLSQIDISESLVLQWRNFSPSGKMERVNGGVFFDHYEHFKKAKVIKSIINCNKVNELLAKRNHSFTNRAVDCNKKEVDLTLGKGANLNYIIDDPPFVINHYIIRSLEHALYRLKRGVARSQKLSLSEKSRFAQERVLKVMIRFSNPNNYFSFNFKKHPLREGYKNFKNNLDT